MSMSTGGTDLAAIPPRPTPTPTRDPAPRRETIVAGPYGYSPAQRILAAGAIDDVVEQFGEWVYELIRLDPAVSGSMQLLFAGILAEGIQVNPAKVAEPGEIVSKRRRRTELKLSETIADFWRDCLANIDPGIDQVLWELLDEATTGGCALAEPVYRLAEDGDWKGKLVLDRMRVKPRRAWSMLVDQYLEVKAIRARTAEGWTDVRRDHFALLSWGPRCGDPRGSRLSRPAYPAWNFKLTAIPDYAAFLKNFADPKLVLTGGDDMKDIVRVVDGIEVVKTVSQQLVEAGMDFHGRGVLGLPKGATATFLRGEGNGESYLKGFDWADREIFRTIILGARGMQEAKHGSKADSESALDVIQMAIQAGRRPLVGCIWRDLFWTGTMLNWGKPVADKFTPRVSFGLSDHMSPAIMAAFADAWNKGLFQTAQRPWMMDKLGAPQDGTAPVDQQAIQGPGGNPTARPRPAPGTDPARKPAPPKAPEPAPAPTPRRKAG